MVTRQTFAQCFEDDRLRYVGSTVSFHRFHSGRCRTRRHIRCRKTSTDSCKSTKLNASTPKAGSTHPFASYPDKLLFDDFCVYLPAYQARATLSMATPKAPTDHRRSPVVPGRLRRSVAGRATVGLRVLDQRTM